MYVIKEMRLNKFQPKPIVSNRELFVSIGARPATINSKETADCVGAPVPDGASKTKMLALAQEISKAAYEHHKAEEVDTLKTNAKDK